jgi:hypothetical protein
LHRARSHARIWVGILLYVASPTASSGDDPFRVPERPGDYHREVKLRVPLTQAPAVGEFRKLLYGMGKAAGDAESLVTDHARGEEWIGVAADEVPLAQLMDATALLCAGSWFLAELNQWSLASSLEGAKLARRQYEAKAAKRGGESAQLRAAVKSFQDFSRSLSPAQLAKGADGKAGRLTPSDLSPAQWVTLRRAIALYAADPNGIPAFRPLPRALCGVHVKTPPRVQLKNVPPCRSPVEKCTT